MALYGKSLSRQIPDEMSGDTARVMFGAMSLHLHAAYEKLSEYDPTGLGQWTGIDAGAGAAAKEYLDSTNAMLAKYFPQMPEGPGFLTPDQLTKLRAAVSISSVAVKYIDDNFSTSFLMELCEAIIEAIGTIPARVANGVSKVAGSLIGGTWWIWLLVAAGMILVSRYKRGVL